MIWQNLVKRYLRLNNTKLSVFPSCLFDKTAAVGGLCSFDVSQMISHRLSEKRQNLQQFCLRSIDTTCFYRQKQKLFKVSASHIVKPNTEDQSDIEVSFLDLELEHCYVYMNETLTSINRMLPREARKKSGRLKNKFSGYTISFKFEQKSIDYIPLNGKMDLVNIT